jgi:hypothetical protein
LKYIKKISKMRRRHPGDSTSDAGGSIDDALTMDGQRRGGGGGGGGTEAHAAQASDFPSSSPATEAAPMQAATASSDDGVTKGTPLSSAPPPSTFAFMPTWAVMCLLVISGATLGVFYVRSAMTSPEVLDACTSQQSKREYA